MYKIFQQLEIQFENIFLSLSYKFTQRTKSQEKQLTIHKYPINNPQQCFLMSFISESEAEEVDETLNETLK